MREELVEDAIQKGLAFLRKVEELKRESLVICIPAKEGGEDLKIFTISHKDL